jgi:hypothetical protein
MDAPTFQMGVANRVRQRIPPRIRVIESSTEQYTFLPQTWEERVKITPEPGHIRILDQPVTDCTILSFMWHKDLTLTEWINKLDEVERESPIANALRPADYLERIKALFYNNQRQRFLARIVLMRWTQRLWRKKTQCNVDMIDMVEIADEDAILLTDTTNRTIFRFHRRDIFTNMLSNICMSDEMLPTPRYPTNPWTNAKLTLGQTIGLCQQLAADFGRRGRCPPVLFAAFWAARFNLKRFQEQNSGLLAQHAVTAFFKDLNERTHNTVFDTITNLLTNAGLDYSPTAIRRWLRQTPITPLHREWMELVRDYTLYINLHVQVRTAWYNEDFIHGDVRRLYTRTSLPNPTSQRIQLLGRTREHPLIPPETQMFGLLELPLLLQPSNTDTMTQEQALQFIQNALFRI